MKEIAKAIRFTRFGAGAAAFMFAFILFSIFIFNEESERLHIWFVIALTYFFVGWGIYNKSRGLAIFGLAFYLYDKIGDWIPYVSGRT